MGAFALTDNEDGRNYLVGLRDMTTKSAADTMDAFQDILADVRARLAEKVAADDRGDAGTQLLLTIEATMTDQAATEKLFNANVEKLINEATAAAATNQLEDADQRVVAKLLRLYCGLHTLVHAAQRVVSATSSSENGHFEGQPPVYNPSFRRANQSGALQLIEEVCKGFARGADEKSGVYSKFISFIAQTLREEFESQSLPLTPFHGSRFSIMFHNGSVTYCLRNSFNTFFNDHPPQNGLTKSIQHNLSVPFYVGEVRAIAILSKLYMKPLWAMLEDKDVDLVKMGEFYQSMISSLEAAAQNPELLLNGCSSFPDKYLRKDKWWDAVFAADEVYPIRLPSIRSE